MGFEKKMFNHFLIRKDSPKKLLAKINNFLIYQVWISDIVVFKKPGQYLKCSTIAYYNYNEIEKSAGVTPDFESALAIAEGRWETHCGYT